MYIDTAGTYRSGTGNHTIHDIFIYGSNTVNLTSGLTTVTGSRAGAAANSAWIFSQSGFNFDANGGTVNFTDTSADQLLYSGYATVTFTFNNIFVTKGTNSLRYKENQGFNLIVNNLTITSGTFDTSDTQNKSWNLNATDTITVSGKLIGNWANVTAGAFIINQNGLYNATNATTLLNGAATISGNYTAGVSTLKTSTASTGVRITSTGNMTVIGTSSAYAHMTRRDADSGTWLLTVERGAFTNFTYVNMTYVNATWNASATILY